MNDMDELLRRDGAQWRATATSVPRVDWAALPGRRDARRFASSWLMVTVAGATAAVVVVLAVLAPSWIGRGATGHKPLPAPAHQPTPGGVQTGPASFVALTDAGITLVNARTGDSYGGSVTESGRHATTLAGSNDGNLAYATFTHPKCEVAVDRQRWMTPYNAEGTQAATISGAKADGIAVSPDGHLLAISVVPCGKNTSVDDLVVVNLDTHQQRRWTGYPDVSFLSALQWAPDNETLSYVVNPCCGGGTDNPRLLDTSAPGTSYVKPKPLAVDVSRIGSGLVLWYGGQFAVVQGTEIHALSKAGVVGAVLAKGLPADVVSVDTDSTGLHLLLVTSQNRLFRYDAGTLTPLPRNWIDASW